jgi:hypothetical protein
VAQLVVVENHGSAIALDTIRKADRLCLLAVRALAHEAGALGDGLAGEHGIGELLKLVV